MASNIKNQSETRTLGFLILSSLFHTALALAVFTISYEAKKMVEITEVEFVDTKPEISPITKAPEAAADTVAPVAKLEAPIEKPVQKEVTAKSANIAKALPVAKSKPAIAKAAPIETTQQISPVVVPVLETADLDQTNQEIAPAELKEEDIATDLDKVDQDQNEKAVALQNQLQQDTEKEIQEQNDKVLALQKETEQENEQLAAENAKNRADERAAAAAQIAAEAESAKLANANGIENGNGAGTGEIRALEDLKQISGNKRPAYDPEDRLKGRQGEVAFLAYVSKAGAISEFKLIKSSGHRQLDAKTLKALRDWKFYPGQEGWVEIPFKWDLKGGPQEMPATLRRAKVSSQN